MLLATYFMLFLIIAYVYLVFYTFALWIVLSFYLSSGRSSGVERNLAKVEVEGSNPFARL